MNGWEALIAILGGLALFIVFMGMFVLPPLCDFDCTRLLRQWMEHRERMARIKAGRTRDETVR